MGVKFGLTQVNSGSPVSLGGLVRDFSSGMEAQIEQIFVLDLTPLPDQVVPLRDQFKLAGEHSRLHELQVARPSLDFRE